MHIDRNTNDVHPALRTGRLLENLRNACPGVSRVQRLRDASRDVLRVTLDREPEPHEASMLADMLGRERSPDRSPERSSRKGESKAAT